MAKFKKSFTNPHLYRQFSNNDSELFDYTMSNIMDNFYDSAMNSSIDGKFKAVCLSGIRTEDNTGAGTDATDAVKKEDFINIIVRPLSDFGNILPDPRRFKDNPEQVNEIISMHGSTFLARSDYEFDVTSPISFGQIVDCYFEKGSIVNSDFKTLRFSEPQGALIDVSFQELATITGVQTAIGSDWSNPSLLGEQPSNSTLPSGQAVYLGSDESFKDQPVENGRIPNQLIGKATKGGSNKPKILKELIPSYNNLAQAFARKFPGKQLGAWGYRTYDAQVSLKKEKPKLAAKPGTSEHGWGLAMDVHYFEAGNPEPIALNYSSKEYKWLKNNASRFGWQNPLWASKGSEKEEPWHWEWINKSQIIKRNK